MKQFKVANDIWEFSANVSDLNEGAKYASISLPWTFNRMSMNASSKGMHLRAFNIAKGIIGQEVLKRALIAKGIKVHLQRKSHRDDDLFDFKLELGGNLVKLDLKTLNHYNNYPKDERQPLSKALVEKFKNYPGPDWRKFFPMPIPHTQIGQDKEGYIFALATSVDFRNDIWADRPSEKKIVAFPFDGYEKFLSSKVLCFEREKNGKGVFLEWYYTPESMFKNKAISLKIVGEWETKLVEKVIKLEPENLVENVGPFSNILSFEFDEKSYKEFGNGQLALGISKNALTTPVRNSLKANINVIPKGRLSIGSSDFCNVVLPSSYKLYFIGWTKKQTFLKNCSKYPGWIWPTDKITKYENQPWSWITENDVKLFTKCGFEDAMKKKPTRVEAGFLKTTGFGGGACCYIYPNIHGGGFKETNLYVLPSDLYTMESI